MTYEEIHGIFPSKTNSNIADFLSMENDKRGCTRQGKDRITFASKSEVERTAKLMLEQWHDTFVRLAEND